jgi:hypothetical protein
MCEFANPMRTADAWKQIHATTCHPCHDVSLTWLTRAREYPICSNDVKRVRSPKRRKVTLGLINP